jgi:hypothetical protein
LNHWPKPFDVRVNTFPALQIQEKGESSEFYPKPSKEVQATLHGTPPPGNYLEQIPSDPILNARYWTLSKPSICVFVIFLKQTEPYSRTDPISFHTAVSNKMDALPKKHLPPISTSSPFEGIFVVHISLVLLLICKKQILFWTIRKQLQNFSFSDIFHSFIFQIRRLFI